MIGLFNTVKFKRGKISPIKLSEVLKYALNYTLNCISLLLCKALAYIFFPFCIVLFLILNLFVPLKFFIPVLEDFSIFHTTCNMYLQITFKFVQIIITHNMSALISNLKYYTADWTFFSLLRLATMLAYLILLGGNVHKNPGPLSFCHWNLGGMPTDNFLKKFLLQAFLCVNDFDIVILGETHLTSKISENELNIDGYYFVRCDHPGDDSRGGIGVYYKSTLPCTFKPELTKLSETLVFQIKVGARKCFFTCVYRNPSSENNSKEKIDEFVNKMSNTLENIKGKNPYINFVIGDLNAKNSVWWGDITDYPGESISDITVLHGLHQIINQPTHFYPGKNPSCIDLIFCSQPNLICETGVLPSLLPQCHHDIIFGKIDFNVKLPPPYKRLMWDYKNADVMNIRRSLLSVNWERCIHYRNANNQAEFLSNSIINTFHNFCPHKIVKCRHKDAPWMTSEIKQKLKEKTKVYNKYVKNKYDLGYKQLLHNKTVETSNLIANAKENYYKNEGKKLLDPSLGPKRYWSILNSFLGNKRMPTIPPLSDNGEIVTDYFGKAEIFNNYFASQCTPLDDNDELPLFLSRTPLSLSSVTISTEKILDLIRSLDPNKSSGFDGNPPA